MKYGKYAPALVRMALGLIFLVFAIDQFVRPDYWLGYLPSWVLQFGIADTTLIMLNASFDLLLGMFLLAGLFTRIIAVVAALHLFGIAFSLGYNDVAVRDMTLGLISLAVAIRGPGELCLDGYLSRRR